MCVRIQTPYWNSIFFKMSVRIQNTLQCFSVKLFLHHVSCDSQVDSIARDKWKYLGLKSYSGIIFVDKFVRLDVLVSILFVLKSGERQSHRYRKEPKKGAKKYGTKDNVYRSVHAYIHWQKSGKAHWRIAERWLYWFVWAATEWSSPDQFLEESAMTQSS